MDTKMDAQLPFETNADQPISETALEIVTGKRRMGIYSTNGWWGMRTSPSEPRR